MARGPIAFHTGAFFAKDPVTNATLQVGTVQEVSFDFKSNTKELFSEKQFAEAVGRGTSKITGKFKTGRFNGALLNQVYFSQPTGNSLAYAKLLALNETATMAGVTRVVTNGANFVEDLGVKYALTEVPLKRVASGPTTGQYSVDESTGTYTVAAGDNAATLAFTYLYKSTASGAGGLIISNQQAGDAPTFRAIFNNKFQQKQLTLILNSVVCDSLNFGFKLEDFAMPEASFSVQDDGSGGIGELHATVFQ